MPSRHGRGGKTLELTVISLLLVAVVLRLGHLLYLLWSGRGGGALGLTIVGLLFAALVLRLLQLLQRI